MKKQHWDFFKDSDSSFGLFYPLHYTLLAFDTLERAEQARRQFLDAGFAEDDVATASGPFVIGRLETEEGANWLDRVRAGIAKVVGTEQGYIDDDLHLARRGGAFLFAYTPDDAAIQRVHRLVPRLHPMYARRYHGAGIESIAYPPQSTI
ncbi:MAG TPA: hypothetical protein VFJ04_08090 [Rhodanobacteraceae bacterium]|jgi:hypothetical protein|nr:hypothetical protein [Rhodanobacteraceae bacterium]